MLSVLAPRSHAIEIVPAYGNLTLAQRTLVDSVIAEWESKLSGGKEATVTITFSFVDLPPGLYPPGAEVIWPENVSERVAVGPLGVADLFTEHPVTHKPSSARVRISNKYRWWEGDALPAGGTWPSSNMYDMRSVLKHEICHAIGFTVNYSKFAVHVTDPGGGANRTYNAGGVPTATLTPAADGTHTDPTTHPGDLMNPALPTCTRRPRGVLDVAILLHGVWNPFKGIPTMPGYAATVLAGLLLAAGAWSVRRRGRPQQV